VNFEMSHERNCRVELGMPVSRFLGEEGARLSFADDELDSIAAALEVPTDLLLD
jgi:hypothetical protein